MKISCPAGYAAAELAVYTALRRELLTPQSHLKPLLKSKAALRICNLFLFLTFGILSYVFVPLEDTLGSQITPDNEISAQSSEGDSEEREGPCD